MSLASDTRLFTLQDGTGLRIQVMAHGATWVSCLVPLPDGSHREVLLGCASLADYQRRVDLTPTAPRQFFRLRK